MPASCSKSRSRILVPTVVVLLSGLLCFTQTGCVYAADRAHDLMDIMDFGVTVNDHWRPDFAVYNDQFCILPLGYSHVDGKVLGWGHRQIGWLDYESHNWGVIAWGSEREGTGAFNSLDPHQAGARDTGAEERPRYHVGLVRIIAQKEKGPPLLHYFEAERHYHLGWIGAHVKLRPLDAVDFILGFTTLDILQDDTKALDRRAEKAEAS